MKARLGELEARIPVIVTAAVVTAFRNPEILQQLHAIGDHGRDCGDGR